MRRPLFDTGFPQKAPHFTTISDPLLTVLDFRSASQGVQQHTYLLTLYGYWVAADETDPTGLNVYVQYGTDTPILVAEASRGTSTADEAPPPYKVLDRIAFRGAFRVLVGRTGAETADVRVYGYYEVDGASSNLLQEVRPLQPSNTLVSPFNAGPSSVAEDTTKDIHLLTSNYVDEVTLSFNMAYEGEFPEPPVLRLDGEDDLPLLPLPTAGEDVIAPEDVLLFDGIPMCAAKTIQIVTGTGSTVRYAGSFRRG